MADFFEYLFTFHFNKVVELSDQQDCRTFWSTLLFWTISRSTIGEIASTFSTWKKNDKFGRICSTLLKNLFCCVVTCCHRRSMSTFSSTSLSMSSTLLSEVIIRYFTFPLWGRFLVFTWNSMIIVVFVTRNMIHNFFGKSKT